MSAAGVNNFGYTEADDKDADFGASNEQTAEVSYLDHEEQDTVDDENVGYGDADRHGCWPRFVAVLRSNW